MIGHRQPEYRNTYSCLLVVEMRKGLLNRNEEHLELDFRQNLVNMHYCYLDYRC
ncbi:hypothetical protein D3C84_505090 [compost metagenome]